MLLLRRSFYKFPAFSELVWRHSRVPLEKCIEICIVLKAHHFGDRLYIVIVVREKITGFAYAHLRKKLMKAYGQIVCKILIEL